MVFRIVLTRPCRSCVWTRHLSEDKAFLAPSDRVELYDLRRDGWTPVCGPVGRHGTFPVCDGWVFSGGGLPFREEA